MSVYKITFRRLATFARLFLFETPELLPTCCLNKEIDKKNRLIVGKKKGILKKSYQKL